MSSADFRAVFDQTASHIQAAHRLRITLGPVLGSYTGQFDGLEIWVDPDKDIEDALFILVHLFGHTVQWNIDEHLREVGLAVTGVKIEDLPRIYLYERQASQLGLGLLAEIGHLHLARWLTDCFGADWKFLDRFYRAGEKLRFPRDTGADEPLLTPLPIPKFTPQRWPPRGSF